MAPTPPRPQSAQPAPPPGAWTRRPNPGRPGPVALALLLALPGTASAASLEVEGGPFVLGRAASARVVVELDGGEEADAPLRLAASAGAFGAPERLGPGRYRALYTPPASRFPQEVLVAAWQDPGPKAEVTLLRLPLHGSIRLAVKAPPGRTLRAEVGTERFGPVRAGPGGEAALSIVVPPLVREARVLVEGGRAPAPLSRAVALEVPRARRLLAVAVPGEAVAGGPPVRLLVFAEGEPGEPTLAAARLRVAASEGGVAMTRAEPGSFTFRYLPPAGEGRQVRFLVTVEGEEGPKAEARLLVKAAEERASTRSTATATPTAAPEPTSTPVQAQAVDQAPTPARGAT